jgi:hypothetical protein
MNRNLEVVTANFILDAVITSFGTPFQADIGFLSLTSPPYLLNGYSRERGRNVKLPPSLPCNTVVERASNFTSSPLTSLRHDV